MGAKLLELILECGGCVDKDGCVSFSEESFTAFIEAIGRDVVRYRKIREQFLHSYDRYDGEDQTKWVMWTKGKVIDPSDGAASFDAAVDGGFVASPISRWEAPNSLEESTFEPRRLGQKPAEEDAMTDEEKAMQATTSDEFIELLGLSPVSPEAYYAGLAWNAAFALGFQKGWEG